MNYTIQEIQPLQYICLRDFLWEAIFVPDNQDLPPRTILDTPELQVYIKDFGTSQHDHALLEMNENDQIIGAIWTRIMKDYGHIDEKTPSLAMSLYKEYRGKGIGTALLEEMLIALKNWGYEQVSLSVQKTNYAYKMYRNLGFYIVGEQETEYIMVKNFYGVRHFQNCNSG